jgi:predicted HTH transcriptional regulator
MSQFILGVFVGALIVWVWVSGKQKETQEEVEKMEKEIKAAEEQFLGLSDYNKKATEIKEQGKEKILNYIKEKGKIDAGQASSLLDVSRYTAFRYLEELQRQGKIEQVGAFGRAVEYRAK